MHPERAQECAQFVKALTDFKEQPVDGTDIGQREVRMDRMSQLYRAITLLFMSYADQEERKE